MSREQIKFLLTDFAGLIKKIDIMVLQLLILLDTQTPCL